MSLLECFYCCGWCVAWKALSYYGAAHHKWRGIQGPIHQQAHQVNMRMPSRHSNSSKDRVFGKASRCLPLAGGLCFICFILLSLHVHSIGAAGSSQKRGKVYLSWTDTSLCETGFGFSRSGASFTPDYLINSDAVCFHRHQPTSVFDDLTIAKSVAVNSVQKYCIRAVNEIGYDSAYHSDAACEEITIAWEASVLKSLTSL